MKKKLGALLIIMAAFIGVVVLAKTAPKYDAYKDGIDPKLAQEYEKRTENYRQGTKISCGTLCHFLTEKDPEGFIKYLAWRNEYAATVNGVKAKVPEEFIQWCYNTVAPACGVDLSSYAAQLQAMGYNVGPANATTTADLNNAAATPAVANTVPANTTTTPANAKAVTPFNEVKVVYAKDNVAFFDKPEAGATALGVINGNNPIGVTGITSDGWYEILFADGGKAYTPAGFFTEEQPK